MQSAILEAAAAGAFPEWAVASDERRAHMDRVARLMGDWAEALGLEESQVTRWRAAGRLHDALRDADGEILRPRVPAAFRDLPDSFLHGPAAAARLEDDGVQDAGVLAAIRYHTLGNSGLDRIGRALIAADFLEPGRSSNARWRSRRRARMPHELDAVLLDVVRAKLESGLARGMPLRPEMIGLWNALASS